MKLDTRLIIGCAVLILISSRDSGSHAKMLPDGREPTIVYTAKLPQDRELRILVSEVDVSLLPEVVTPRVELPPGHRVVSPQRLWQVDVEVFVAASKRSVRIYSELVPEYLPGAPFAGDDRGGLEVIEARLEGPAWLVLLTREPWSRNQFTLRLASVGLVGPPTVFVSSTSADVVVDGRTLRSSELRRTAARLEGSLREGDLAVVVRFTRDSGESKDFRFLWDPETRRLELDEEKAPATLPGDR